MRVSRLFVLSACFAGLWTTCAGTSIAQTSPGGQQSPTLTAVALDAKSVASFIDATKDVAPLEAKIPNDGDPDAKLKVDLDTAAKKHDFTGYQQYEDVGGAISAVMEGIDPESKRYVGAQTVLKKQIANIQADKTMSAKDKKDALAELDEELKSSSSIQPSPANIEIVTRNFDKLSAAVGQD